MTHIEMGVTGAKRQSWRNPNPRDLLRSLLEKHPDADDAELFEKFHKRVQAASEAMQETIERYWFDNNIRSLRLPTTRRSPVSTAQRRETLVRDIQATVTRRIVDEAERLLLEMIMPNGKPLRDCTGTDCRQIGGWLAEMASKLKPAETVGSKFSEDQVRSHWRRMSGKQP